MVFLCSYWSTSLVIRVIFRTEKLQTIELKWCRRVIDVNKIGSKKIQVSNYNTHVGKKADFLETLFYSNVSSLDSNIMLFFLPERASRRLYLGCPLLLRQERNSLINF